MRTSSLTSTHPDKETLELRVIVSEFLPIPSAQLAFYSLVTLPNGQQMPRSQVVHVLDPDLISRLETEARPGDAILVTLETDWGSESLSTVLLDFCLLPCPERRE